MKSTLEIVQECLPTLDQALVLANLAEEGDNVLDRRDATRLGRFLPESRLHEVGLKVADGETFKPMEWNAENVAKELTEDIEFSFSKALGKRGISASLMSSVLQMWKRVLAPNLVLPDYPQYGLPIIKAMALHFNAYNQIGDNIGNEYKYSMESDLNETDSTRICHYGR